MKHVPISGVIGLIALGVVGWKWTTDSRGCTVGFVGADASMSLAGWGSRSACKAMIQEHPSDYYLRTTPPTGSVLCEFDREGVHYIVRDQGMLMVVGRTTCASLAPGSTRPR